MAVVRKNGLPGLLRSGWRFAVYAGKYFFHRDWVKARRIHREFDRKHNVETRTSFSAYILAADDPQQNAGYEPIREDRFHRFIQALGIEDYASFTFVDLGSGKGRALLLASAYPFRRIVGVEFSPALHQVAERNLRTFQNPARKCREISALCLDARAYEFPPGDLLIYLYHPFGAAILGPILANLERALRQAPPRRVYAIYARGANYESLAPVFEACPALKLVRSEPWESFYQAR